MNRPSLPQTIGGTVVIVAIMGAAALLEHVRETAYPAPPPTQETLYVTSGKAAQRMSIGYSSLVADLYWIRAIQYYGTTKIRLTDNAPGAPSAAPADYELLYPLLDVTTSLDPRFNIAYRFGSIFLAEAPPAGAGRPDLAIALLEKGLQARPDKWEYMQDIGFVNYWWRKDYESAAAWFDKASKVPGAPWFLRSQAAVTLAQGGDRHSSRTMWTSILETADNDWLRNDAERRLQQLDTADVIDAIQYAIDAAKPRTGTLTTWPDLIRAGVVRRVPADLRGVPLGIDREARVHLAIDSPLYPLPDELPRQ